MARLRILHAIHDFLPRHRAGSQIYAFELARALSQRHDVWVLAAEYDPSAPHGQLRWRSHGDLPVVEIVNNWAFREFADTYSSARINCQISHVLRAVEPDIVHVHNLLNLSFDLPRLARERGARPVATLHDYTLVCPSGGQRVHKAAGYVCHTIDPDRCATCFTESPFAAQMAIAKTLDRRPGRALAGAAAAIRRRLPMLADALIRRAPSPAISSGDVRRRLAASRSVLDAFDLIVSPSVSMAEEYERLGANPARMEISRYGSAVRPAPRLPNSRGTVSIGFVGSLVWHKGAHLLLDAARGLTGAFEVVLHGDPAVAPDYLADLRRRAQGLPVRFAGPFVSDEVPRIYGGIDLLVVPSLWPENAPLVIQEAALHGVPVVGAAIGGIPEFVREGVNGALFAAGDADSLRRVLQGLLDDPAHRARLSAAAPFIKTIDEDARDWERRYARVLAGAVAPVALTVPS